MPKAKKNIESSAPTEERIKAPVHNRKGTRKAKEQEKKDIGPAKKSGRGASAQKPRAPRAQRTVKPEVKVKIVPLGGLGEIGKNMTAFEYENDIIVVDCGLGFPEDDMPGVDLVIPDTSYLEQNADRVRGILLTHGHEDHIGAVPYVLRTLDVPIYGTALTMGIVKKKLTEHKLAIKPRLETVSAGDRVHLGAFTVEFIHVNHSIADACALAIDTPNGVIIHSGDFKLDVSPIDGDIMDVVRLGELGRKGVLLLMCESTNAERGGFAPSERSVGGTLDGIFRSHENKRVVVTTFSSNVHRVQQVIDISVKYNRRVAISGRSMLNVVRAATDLGYMSLPEGTLVDISEIKRFSPGELTIITTGSQGEPMSALYRMAYGDHAQVTLGCDDVVVLSSSAIPGNEKLIDNIINELLKSGVKVVHDTFGVHASGHACAEEIKMLIALTKPKFYMPIHGEYRHLVANRELAMFMGVPSENIAIADIGEVYELGRKSLTMTDTVPSGKVMIDGLGVGDVGRSVLRDRQHMAEDGIVIVFVSVDLRAKLILTPPEIETRGFVYVPESAELMESAMQAVYEVIETCFNQKKGPKVQSMQDNIRRDLTKLFVKSTGRKPLIIPIIADL